MKIKRIIKLVNNERLNTKAISGKSCETGTDYCYPGVEDSAHCMSNSIDICVIKDAAACYESSKDVCAMVEDTYACHGGSLDYT